ncbi:MAG TPA: FAD-dependent oxidoreductase, partial [Acidocella sp.]|nr:FAD-dependent oxidoreductase [Acidocella sp.]
QAVALQNVFPGLHHFADGEFVHGLPFLMAEVHVLIDGLMRSRVQALAPGDVQGYEKFIALSEEIYRIGFEKLAHKAFGSWTDMLRILPELVRLSGYRSVSGLVARYIRDKRLRIALSFHPLLVGGNPLDTSAIYALILYLERKSGVHFPIGGTGALVTAMARLIERQGNRLRTAVTVEEILVDDGKAVGVTLQTGETI